MSAYQFVEAQDGWKCRLAEGDVPVKYDRGKPSTFKHVPAGPWFHIHAWENSPTGLRPIVLDHGRMRPVNYISTLLFEVRREDADE
jgi:hypothetical protein